MKKTKRPKGQNRKLDRKALQMAYLAKNIALDEAFAEVYALRVRSPKAPFSEWWEQKKG